MCVFLYVCIFTYVYMNEEIDFEEVSSAVVDIGESETCRAGEPGWRPREEPVLQLEV